MVLRNKLLRITNKDKIALSSVRYHELCKRQTKYSKLYPRNHLYEFEKSDYGYKEWLSY